MGEPNVVAVLKTTHRGGNHCARGDGIRPRHAAALAVAALFWCAGPASGQTIRGVVTDRASGHLLPDVSIVLLDSANASRTSSLSDEQGRFVIAAPREGLYRLRLDAIGFFSDTTAAFRLTGTDTISQLVKFARRPRDLPPVVVSAKSGCVPAQDAGVAVASLWEEVRKALETTERSMESEHYRFDLLQYERELDPRSRKVRRTKQWERIGMTGQPYESIPAESLAAFGYVRVTPDGTWYYAPDARTLLADTFVRTHCLKPVPDGGDHPALVGLAFEPMYERETADVRGVLWLDASTSQLRFLAYQYTGLTGRLAEYGFGGRVEFERLPSGAWVVDRWQITMPRVSRETRSMPSTLPEVGPPRLVPVTVDVVAGIIERGGEVKARDRVGEPSVRRHATLRGSIFDSTANAPLADAEVWLDMSGEAIPVRRTSSDGSGNFRMDSVPPGTYRLTVTHPRLDTLGSFLAPITVTTTAGHDALLTIATPSLSSLTHALCPGGLEPDAALMHGVVRRDNDGMSVAGARVAAHWNSPSGRGSTSTTADTSDANDVADATGHYTLCGLPRGTPIVVTATDARSRGEPLQVTLDSERIASVTLYAPIHSAEITGRVSGRNGRPLRLAEVRLVDADIAVRPDTLGKFRITAVPPGTHVVEARSLGYAPVRRRVESRAAVSLTIDFTLDAVAQVLRPVRKMATRDPFRTGFDARMKHNRGGHFLTNDDVRKSGLSRVTDLLASVPGLERRMVGTQPVIEFTGRGTRTFSPTGCPVAYMVDGVPYEPAGLGLDGEIGVANVEAIEVYDAATVPAEFTRRDSGCGVILIWTRERSVVDEPADSGRVGPTSPRTAPVPTRP